MRKTGLHLLFSALGLLTLCHSAQASILIAPDSIPTGNLLEKLSRMNFEAYGSMNYYHFDWQTDSTRRDAIDNELLVAEFTYAWTDKIRGKAEIEFEHGGTGSSLEFDRFEEFGEFEFDISKGGEVLVEELNIAFDLGKNYTLQVGRLRVPFGASFTTDEPVDYLTATYSEMEAQILPRSWTENGIALEGYIGAARKIKFHTAIINGLDGTGFNSANWIKRGHQLRFETINAENFAFCARLDFSPAPQFTGGISLYGGNTTNNRPKPDLKVDAPLGIGELHFSYHPEKFSFRGMVLFGALGNSEALTNQNRNISNNLNVKRTPVGASALGAFAEIAVPVIKRNTASNRSIYNASVVVYGRWDFYDTMHSTQGQIFNNPRWARTSYTAGGVWKIIDDIHVKAQYTLREVGAPAPTSVNGGTIENNFILGLAFEL